MCDELNTRECYKCKKIKDLSQFYFRKESGNYRHDCKDCFNGRGPINYSRRVVKTQLEIDIERGWKNCEACKKDESLDFFRLMKSNSTPCYSNKCYKCNNNKIKISFLEQVAVKGVKKCIDCLDKKNLSEFRFNKDKDIYHSFCLECEKRFLQSKKLLKISEPNNPSFPSEFNKNEPKFCSFCQTEKKLIDFYFIKRTERFQNCCIQCHSNKIKNPRIKALDIDLRNGWKICNVCTNKKTLDCFFFSKRDDSYAGKCQECWSKQKMAYKKNRRETDIEYRLLETMRCSVANSLRAKNHKKESKTRELLGCDIYFYRQYIENLFENGMNWKNRGNKPGTWSLDHIYPLELFDFSDQKQIEMAFNYTNTRPLWFEANNSKNDWLLDINKRARELSKEEKMEYLISKGFKIEKSPAVETGDLEFEFV